MSQGSFTFKLVTLVLILTFVLVGCTYDFTEKNLARYKKYIGRHYSRYVTPQRSSCEDYENSLSKDEWELIWADEFDYKGLPDDDKWDYYIGIDEGLRQLQYYTEKRMENARVENGTLIIEARNDGFGDMKYTSARLVTRHKADWTYVKIDVKAKMPTGRGVWPAIWLWPTDNVYGWWPGEIDMVEIIGFNPCAAHFSVHTEKYNWTIHTQKSVYTELEAPYEQYHIYSLEWDPDKITILVDGIPYFRYEKNGSQPSSVWPFDQKFYLIMNIAVGGTWGGVFGVDTTIFPQQMMVDYVRVYQKK